MDNLSVKSKPVRKTTITALMLLCLVRCALAQGNLVVNGGFDIDASGWTLANGAYYISVGGNPGGCIALNPPSATAPTISQTIQDLMPGVAYIVSGDYMGDLVGKNMTATNTFGVALDESFLFETVAPTNFNWNSFCFAYTPISTSGVLSLSSEANGTGASYLVDNIAMYVAPEPSLCWLLFLGSGVLFYFFRRRRIAKS